MDEIDDLDEINVKNEKSLVLTENMSMTTVANTNNVLNFVPRPKMKLSEVERLIRKHRIITPCPSRQTLINMCEEGDFETAGDEPTKFGWLVFEESFWKWARKLDGLPVAA